MPGYHVSNNYIALICLNKQMAINTGMSRQTRDQVWIYYEIGINIFNCWLSHMKHNRPLPSLMEPIMTWQDKNLFLCNFLFKSTEQGRHGHVRFQECKLKCAHRIRLHHRAYGIHLISVTHTLCIKHTQSIYWYGHHGVVFIVLHYH